MYFSGDGREMLVETMDRLLIAKKSLDQKGVFFPDKTKFYVTENSNEIEKIEYFKNALEHVLNARVEFDPNQETAVGRYDDRYSFHVYLDELDEFTKLNQRNKNVKVWKARMHELITKHLQEVYGSDPSDVVMEVQIGELGNLLQVGIEGISFGTFHDFFDSFLKFQKDLEQLNAEIKAEEKGRRSA